MRRGRPMILESPTIRITLLTLVLFTLMMSASLLSTQYPQAEAYEPGARLIKVKLQGSGSSFLYPQLAKWIDAYTSQFPHVQIEYSPTGSGSGQRMLLDQVVDFAGSDPPLKSNVWKENRGRIAQVPVILGAVAVVYNLPGISEPLNLTAEVLALIYKGEIEYWDDPRLQELNPGAALPHKRIIVVHRSDSSGTTQVFTTYLNQHAPEVWGEELVGKSIEWPVDATGRGVGGKGNQGVLDALLSTEGSIGYLEASYALESGLGVARVRNLAGEFVLPTSEAVSRAALGALPRLPSSPWEDWNGVLEELINSGDKQAYPISSFSFIMFWKPSEPSAESTALLSFLKWVLSEGQSLLVEGYSPLPPELSSRLSSALAWEEQ